ncbi:unnamed protein product [Mytilus edulis]|uniref:Uncharacterized protein n=1 Tax=Mytilus edulis TaxID=6550 RepID=A0A8S3UNQ7_MYTED|nr:unnamed protein product [Mytilus edulis]
MATARKLKKNLTLVDFSCHGYLAEEIHNDWIELDDADLKEFVDNSLTLRQGAVYSIRVGAVNKGGFMAAFETNGVKIDITPPIIHWLHVNTLSDDVEQIVYGYVWQADTNGIKAAWRAIDHQSGIKNYKIAVGSSPGGTEVKSWSDIGLKTDKYIDELSLDITNIDTKTPVYYVSLIAVNSAGLESSPVISTPIVVVEADKAGIVIDGTDSTDHDPVSDIGIDVDYQTDISTLSVQFKGFESHLHGVMAYEWAVGTSPGGQDVTTFSSDGILHVEEQNIAGNGISSSGYAQVNAQLEPGKTYYSAIRGVTNAGNIIESVSDGITVDLLPPDIVLDSTTDSLSAIWHYNDTDSEVIRAWYSVGTYPYAEDISLRTEVNISSTQSGHLEVGSITPDITGKPNIISIWAEDKAGMIGKTTFGSVIIDTSKPGTGYVTCPEYIGVETPILCSWSGFLDEESPIQKFIITLGSEQGSSDIFEETLRVNPLLDHGKSYYVTVTAINSVAMETYAFSGPISIDTTPPRHGKVVDLHTVYRINVKDNSETVAMNAKICSTDEECDALDAVCSESLTSVSATWQLFTDDESDIVGLVYVSIRGTNGAGVSSVATSNGVYISYLSQGLQPLSHIAISDVLENSDADVDFQKSFDTLRASWDMSVSENGMLDGLHMKDRELYYSLLRVTNALNYTYIIRSNGVTIEEDPLLPGKVFDGYITGFDLNILPSQRKVTANWDGFGLPASASFQVDVEGNPGYQVDDSKTDEQHKTQQILYYEVSVGTDRRFPKTRDNVVPFTNVGGNKSVTFYDLNLESGLAIYYFTVRAYSVSYSVAMVTSNGFHVGYDGGVEGGSIIMGDYIDTDTYVDIQFEGFTSKLDIMMYYIGLSNHTQAVGTDCKQYIDGRKGNQAVERTFNIATLININLNTFFTLTSLKLNSGETYYAWVIAADESGDCGMIYHKFTVDTTPPLYGAMTAGPFYNMMNIPYTVMFKVTNGAGLSIVQKSSPVLYDPSKPTAGTLQDGPEFSTPQVWFSSTKTITARDHRKPQMFTGAYYRPASFENGGTYHVSIKPAHGHGIAVTEILFWDGLDTSIATYEYEEPVDWASSDCEYCNCSRYLSDKYGNSTIPTVPSTTTGTTVLTTTQPYDIVNNPDNGDVSEPIDTSIPMAQRACGIQVFSDHNSKIVTWCRSFNDIHRIMKTAVDYNVTEEFLNFKIIFKPEMDDAVDGGTNPIIKYKVGIGSDKLLTDVEPFREVIVPCIPCFGECSKYNCDRNCNLDQHVDFRFTLTDLDLTPQVVDVNETGHYYNKTIIYYLTGKAVTGAGDTALSSSPGFYIDLTRPVFDLDVMMTSQYILMQHKESFSQLVTKHLTTLLKLFGDVLMKKEDIHPFEEDVVPVDAMESTDPTTIGFTFTVSEDKSVKRYDMCIGTDKYLDNIFPCTWVGYNTSGSASIKDGYLYIDNIKLRPLSELKTKVWNISYESTENKTSAFHMEPGRALFMTMRVCNEAVLCTNKSIGSVLITNTETVLKTSEKGESIEIIQSVATNSTRKKRDTDVIVIYNT